MSPYYFYWISSTDNNAYLFHVNGSGAPGSLNGVWVSSSNVVRPVVSLKSNTLVPGSGTGYDPYVVNGLE